MAPQDIVSTTNVCTVLENKVIYPLYTQDMNYGSVRYSSSLTDQVKRPRDPVRQVYDRLKGDASGGGGSSSDSSPSAYGGRISTASGGGDKDGGAWATGIRHFEKSPPKASSFENLHSELRKSKGLTSLGPKDSSQDTWGEMRFFQEKPKTTSPLDMLRDRMQKVKEDDGNKIVYL
jgi:hypothetical protein